MQSPNESPIKEESGVETPCDFAIVVEGETISVPQNILEANSGYLRALLAGGMTEVQNGCCIVTVRNASVEAVNVCLEYITTNGEVLRLHKGTVTDIISLANLWQLDNAVQKCKEFMKETLNLPSWTSTMRTAALYELRDLEEWCVTYFIRCLDECGQWEGVLQMSEYEVKAILAQAYSVEDSCKLWLLFKKWWKHKGGTAGTIACRIIRIFPSILFRNSWFQRVACQDEHMIFCKNCRRYVLDTATDYLNSENCWILRKFSVDTGQHSVTERISEFMIQYHESVFAEKELMKVEVDEFLSYFGSLNVGSNIRASRRMYPGWNCLWHGFACGGSCMAAADCESLRVLARRSYYENIAYACSSMEKKVEPDKFEEFSMRQLMYNLAALNGDHTIWKTTMRWIQADYVNRRTAFLRSFVDFPLYKFSTRFIEDNMSSSTLLRESPECMDKLKSEIKKRNY